MSQQEEARKAQAESAAAAELLKPGGQSLVEYPQQSVPAPMAAQPPSAAAPPQPLPPGAVTVAAEGQPVVAGGVAYPQQYAQYPVQQVPAAPPPPPPAFSNAFNSFLAQVNKQAGAALQQKWQARQQAALAAKEAAEQREQEQQRNAQLDLEKTAHAGKVLAARREQAATFAKAFHTSHTVAPALAMPKPALPTDVESGFLDTIIQRAGANGDVGAVPSAGGAETSVTGATAGAVGEAGLGAAGEPRAAGAVVPAGVPALAT